MSNVLPLEARKQVIRRFRMRFLLAGSLTLLLTAIIAALALLPTLISIRVAQESLRTPETAATETARDDQQQQLRAQTLIEALKPVTSATSSPTEAVAAALGAKPAGVSITSVLYSSGAITLSGMSQNRQAVNAYSDALRGEELFTDVAVPVAALVGAQDGRFTVTLTGSF